MSAVRLVLARHGQTPANVARILDTRLPGPGLTDLGREQADALGRELAAEEAVAAVYHSTALRGAQTAEVVGARLGLEPLPVEGVHEVQVGDLEGRNDEEAIEAFLGVYAAWLDGELDRPQPGGESGHDVLARFVPAVDALRARHPDGGTIVLVSHGASLRLAAQSLVGGAGAPPAGEDHVGNCGRVVVTAPGTRDAPWRLEQWRGAVPGGLPSSVDVTG